MTDVENVNSWYEKQGKEVIQLDEWCWVYEKQGKENIQLDDNIWNDWWLAFSHYGSEQSKEKKRKKTIKILLKYIYS